MTFRTAFKILQVLLDRCLQLKDRIITLILVENDDILDL